MTASDGKDGSQSTHSSSRLVFMLSGQGSQRQGMGTDLFGIREVDEAFTCASDVMGFDVAACVREENDERLRDTRLAQPALCALSVGIAHALMARGVKPDAVLGFSLGQISALAIAGMLAMETTFEVVKARSVLMAEAAEQHPGAMTALLNASEEEVRTLCSSSAHDGTCALANINGGGQIVIGGDFEALARAEAAWAARGNRFVRLSTAGAFHTPLMVEAAARFSVFLEEVAFKEPLIPLIDNVDARPLTVADARSHLVLHLTSPVRFSESIDYVCGSGACRFMEVGYGGVLSGLVKRIDRTVERSCVQDAASFDAACSAAAASLEKSGSCEAARAFQPARGSCEAARASEPAKSDSENARSASGEGVGGHWDTACNQREEEVCHDR